MIYDILCFTTSLIDFFFLLEGHGSNIMSNCIIGGSGNKSSTKSSEFVNLETGAREGPELPFEAWGHSMIKYRYIPSSIYSGV